MITPMLDPAFGIYGKIEQFSPEQASELRPVNLSPSEEISLYCFPEETRWDYVSGMTILLIRAGEEQRLFYLDRSVTIRPGVCFGFYALGQNSVIAGQEELLTEAYRVDRILPAEQAYQEKPLEIFTLFRQSSRDGLYFRGEQHPPLELVYLEKGVLHNYCDGRDIVLHAEEMILFGPDQWHMQYADEPVRFFTISFSWEEYDFAPWIHQVILPSGEMKDMLSAMLKEYDQALPDRQAFLQAQLKLLLLQLRRRPSTGSRHRTASLQSEQVHRQIIDQALQEVSSRIGDRLTVPKLAAAVNVSPSQLTNLFQTYLGVSPAKYITRIRLEESKMLLGSRGMSVGEVAKYLGYSSVPHFSKQFRDWFGYCPSSYRKE